jgi:RNA polymerase sigma-70 factor (ECF subfamily)
MSHLEPLIERWKAGDTRAAEDIYNLTKERVYRLSYGLLGNSEDAEEAAQDALTYALLKIENFDPRRSRFNTWLHMITVSRCRDIYRKRHKPALSLSSWFRSRHGETAAQSTPESRVVEKEDRNTIWQAVQELPPVLREAVILRYWGEYTYQEIGEILGCPIRTAQSRVRLAHQRLGKRFSESNLRLMPNES